MRRLLELGLPVDAVDAQGCTALLRAVADPDLRDALNRTPREIAVMRGFVAVAAEYVPIPSGVSMARFLREPRH